MSAKHTLGPWAARGPRENGVALEYMIRVSGEHGDGNTLALVFLGGPGAISAQREDVEANARLIAAAPDMYDVLRDIADSELPADAPSTALERRTILRARAALAKAEGR